MSGAEEIHVPAMYASERPEFYWLGLTDAALIAIDRQDIVLLTADPPLCNAALQAGPQARNFNDYRQGLR